MFLEKVTYYARNKKSYQLAFLTSLIIPDIPSLREKVIMYYQYTEGLYQHMRVQITNKRSKNPSIEIERIIKTLKKKNQRY